MAICINAKGNVLEENGALVTSRSNFGYTSPFKEMINSIAIEKNRILTIDIMRGIVMVIMALDHVRDFFHETTFVFDPTDLTKTNALLFFTRWITHFCAPTFVFLSGTSIYLKLKRKTKRELSRFLLTRGAWLVIVELTIMRFALLFNFYYDATFLIIIWVLGVDMMIMAGLIYLSDRMALLLGLAIMFGYTFLGPIPILTSNGFYPITPDFALIESYPIIPWLGIMLLGFSAGKLYASNVDAERRKKVLIQIGIASIILFISLRWLNNYGDSKHWSVQKDNLFTFISFMNVTKTPASLLFALMTLGPVMIFLSLIEHVKPPLTKLFLAFGRVPLFYFILHFYIIHTAALAFYMYRTGKSFSQIDFHFSKSFGGLTPDGGVSLLWVYVIWLILILILYPICKAYDRYKSTHKDWWLSYL